MKKIIRTKRIETKKIRPKRLNTKRVIASVGASLAFEGLKPSMHAQVVGKRYLEGKISSSEAIAKVKAKHASSFRDK
ncbi:antitoxin VbhA family protein [Candidatus Contubernalis alkaliaceticus]|uniref:antitoxin VbhA family protein n=1 Tax=Candidatus Contubernalis alkaliaceticus TaxID=338645 RepID=UPI001F4C1098|nr:antitoxin VbhA family protein [Candidatus Contubernalis alkalaceticus]